MGMRFLMGLIVSIFLVVSVFGEPSLLEVRGDFKTKLIKKEVYDGEVAVPPEGSRLKVVRYPTKLGKMLAYLSVAPEGKSKLPAIIWLTGGLPPASPGAFLWEETRVDNEQSARVYRYGGVVTMFPTVRGMVKGNPGQSEHFYGEVNDVLDAYEYLKKLEYVDSERIYLGGHSGGGTLALLVAESTDKFAGIISMGPTDTDYGKERASYEWTDKERALRAPVKYLGAIKSRTFILEGETGNTDALKKLAEANKNPLVSVYEVKGADHFNVIHPVNKIFANAILASKDGKLEIGDGVIETSGCSFYFLWC